MDDNIPAQSETPAPMDTPESILSVPDPTPPATDPAPTSGDDANSPEGLDNLLGDDTPSSPADDTAGESKSEDDPWSCADSILEKLDAIPVGKTFDGEEITIRGADLRAAVPVLRKHGVDSSHAQAVMAAYAAIDGARLAQQNASDIRAINAMARDTRVRLGADYDRTIALAKKGMGMMAPELSAALNRTPSLVNDYNFIRFLADVGARLGSDTGTSGTAGAPRETGFDVTQLLPRGNR